MTANNFNYDAVLILSQSNWFSEMRSNRYNYAIRFAQLAPVYFIQIYNPEETKLIAGVEDNITILNPLYGYTTETLESLLRIVKRQTRAENILIWIYTPHYIELLNKIAIPFTAVYHATEAYLNSTLLSDQEKGNVYLQKLRKTINFCSFTIAVSEGVASGIRKDPEIIVPVYTVTNGCDYNFWNGLDKSISRSKKVVYQGGIHRKIDFDLLIFIIQSNPEINFTFCGEESIEYKEDKLLWKKILLFPNVEFKGRLHPDEVRTLSHHAKVGIIPFRKDNWLKNMAFPLKAFEYLASGLEVVSTPVDALIGFPEHFSTANNYEEFNLALRESLNKTTDYTDARIELCRQQDYDVKFRSALTILQSTNARSPLGRTYKKNVLLLYDRFSCHVNTIREHVNAYGIFSKHSITFYGATSNAEMPQDYLDSFDALVIHYSVRISSPGHLSPQIYKGLRGYKGLKILFIQDEYDNLASTYDYMKKIDFDVVFTCVPPQFHDYVYPVKLFPHMTFIQNLTGYLPYTLSNYSASSVSEREVDVFYRGRELPYFYGSLGREKYEIGIKFQEACRKNGITINSDIDANNTNRIYGDAWYRAISKSKTMLGTESGSNVFDFNGTLKAEIDQDISEGHDYNYVYSKRLKSLETKVRMNQISPKVFEAILLKTVLVLYEGEYSGVLTPWRHYLPLKKDFSNVGEIVDIIRDDQKLAEISENTFIEIARNPLYSYKHFIHESFDKAIDDNVIVLRTSKVNPDGRFTVNSHQRVKRFSFRKTHKYSFGYMQPTIFSEEAESTRDNQIINKKLTAKINDQLKSVIITFVDITPLPVLEFLIRQLRLMYRKLARN